MDAGRILQVRMGKLLKNSSKFIVDRFLTDTGEEEDAFIQLEDFHQRLTVAANRKLLVVLQLKSSKKNEIEILSGWVLTKRTNEKQVIIKLLNGPVQWRIVDIRSIQKMSLLPKKEK